MRKFLPLLLACLAATDSRAESVDVDLQERYIRTLQQAIQMHWLRPESARPGLRCVLQIEQTETGKLIDLRIAEPCNADAATRRSLEAAVRRAEPLPHAGFERVWSRRIDLTFRSDR
jgi:colicin import membrane protein